MSPFLLAAIVRGRYSNRHCFELDSILHNIVVWRLSIEVDVKLCAYGIH